eukprot:scaffold20817_cov22-Cyclotella_meneghiniana.AAC.3
MDGFVHVKSLTCRLLPRGGGEKRGGKVGMLTSFIIVRACDGRLSRAVTVTVSAVVLSFWLDLTN